MNEDNGKYYTIKAYKESIRATALKYRQLNREIREIKDERVRSNLEHTASKLGIFLDEVLGNDPEREEPILNIAQREEQPWDRDGKYILER